MIFTLSDDVLYEILQCLTPSSILHFSCMNRRMYNHLLQNHTDQSKIWRLHNTHVQRILSDCEIIISQATSPTNNTTTFRFTFSHGIATWAWAIQSDMHFIQSHNNNKQVVRLLRDMIGVDVNVRTLRVAEWDTIHEHVNIFNAYCDDLCRQILKKKKRNTTSALERHLKTLGDKLRGLDTLVVTVLPVPGMWDSFTSLLQRVCPLEFATFASNTKLSPSLCTVQHVLQVLGKKEVMEWVTSGVQIGASGVLQNFLLLRNNHAKSHRMETSDDDEVEDEMLLESVEGQSFAPNAVVTFEYPTTMSEGVVI